MELEGSTSRALLCLAALLLASACTHMGFQRGGNAAGFEEARSQCKAAPAEDYKSCMHRAGWFTGGSSLTATAKPTAARPTPAPKPAVQEAQPTQQSSTPAVEKPSTPTVAETTSPSTESPPPRKPPAEDEAMVAVGSWWKIGGSAAALEQALKTCGAAPSDRAVSHTTLTCMQAKGWYAQGS